MYTRDVPPLPRYGVALVAVALALAARMLLDPVLGDHVPFITLFGAYAVVVWYGGVGPAVLATLLGFLGAHYAFVPPRGSFGYRGMTDLWTGVAHLTTSGILIGFGEAFRRAKRRAEDAAEHARLRERVAEVRRRSEERFRSVLAASVRIVWTTGPAGSVVEDSPSWCAFTGQTSAERRGMGWLGAIHPDDRERVARAWSDAVREGRDLEIEYRLRRPDGGHTWTAARHILVPNDDGSVREWVVTNADIAERKLAEERQASPAAIVESSDDAIIGQTLEGIITSWNPGAEHLFGYSAAEMIGRSVSRLVPPERPDDFRAILDAIRHGERLDHYETDRIRKDGRRLHVSLTVSPIKDAGGRIVGASKIARDVSERKRSELERERLLAAAQRARGEAEAASRAKDAFLATVSHELRTPLSPILAWSSMLRQGTLDAEKTARAVEAIERCAKSQAQLIDDLLDVSRIVAGKLRLDVRPVDLAPLVRTAMEVVRPAADAKGIRLRSVLEPRAARISGDPVRLQQVIWNLLSNAVKFTPHGGRVEVVLENRDSHVGLAVSDTGQGISSAFLPHVFERFQQADATTTRRHGGLGLGLAIVRHIVELHGGSVRAESPGEGRGSVFTVRLPPLARAPAAGAQRHGRPPEAVAQLDPSRSLQGIRVAVVDDDPDSNEVVRVLLVSHGAEVEVAGSALQALALLRRWKADVLLSDIGMPSEDGYALLRKLRESDAPGSKPLPAIALTAYGSDRDRARLLAAGFEAHLPKPVDGGELVALVARLAAGTPAAGVCEQVLLVEDDADVAEGLRALLERPGRLVRVAHDGEAALAAAREEAPDVMLVDIGLPRMDGHTLAKRVREDRDLQHVVLVALTGYGGPEDRRAALAAGFHRHVVKPVGREVLEKLLGELARQRASGSAGS